MSVSARRATPFRVSLRADTAIDAPAQILCNFMQIECNSRCSRMQHYSLRGEKHTPVYIMVPCPFFCCACRTNFFFLRPSLNRSFENTIRRNDEYKSSAPTGSEFSSLLNYPQDR